MQYMKKEQLKDGYSFPGFYPLSGIKSFPGNSQGKVIHLKRRQKKRYVAVVERSTTPTMIRKVSLFGIYPVVNGIFIYNSILDESFAKNA